MNYENISNLREKSQDRIDFYLGLALIIICSVLLGIWAIKHTIALRNVLLWLGGILSIIYSYPVLKKNFRIISIGNWIPILLLITIFCWIIFHHIFLSQYTLESYAQLKSTWLRSFLAAILAFGCGLALARCPSKVPWLFFGICLSYIPLYYQYFFVALDAKSFFAPNYDGYILYGKINGVLIGTLLLAALGGISLDNFRIKKIVPSQIHNCFNFFFVTFFLVVIFSYICIFDTRNGTGIALMLFLIWLTFVSPRLLNIFKKKYRLNSLISSTILAAFIVILISGLFKVQDKFNPGWRGFFEDVEIAIQIDKYPNWINFEVLNYPVRASGEGVRGNTYVRFAWATMGLRLINQNPLGIGTNREPFRKILNEMFGVPMQGENPLSTHSGLIDLTLAYGAPFTFLIVVIILCNACLAIKNDGVYKCLILAILIAIFPLYLLGELSTGHAVEMLLYFLSLTAALNLAFIEKCIQV